MRDIFRMLAESQYSCVDVFTKSQMTYEYDNELELIVRLNPSYSSRQFKMTNSIVNV